MWGAVMMSNDENAAGMDTTSKIQGQITPLSVDTHGTNSAVCTLILLFDCSNYGPLAAAGLLGNQLTAASSR